VDKLPVVGDHPVQHRRHGGRLSVREWLPGRLGETGGWARSSWHHPWGGEVEVLAPPVAVQPTTSAIALADQMRIAAHHFIADPPRCVWRTRGPAERLCGRSPELLPSELVSNCRYLPHRQPWTSGSPSGFFVVRSVGC
jgi:hypothetical protein